jgi:TPP-dependent pyruvate/acetoin dehydrogenase alpha subunit
MNTTKLKAEKTTSIRQIALSDISIELCLEMYRRMVLIRRFEDTIYDAYSRGIMPGLAHLYTGQEAVAVGVCMALTNNDTITSTHRGHGHLIAKGGDPKRMIAELFGKATGYNKGKGGSMHIVDMSLGILGANGVVAGGLGIATGAALSAIRLGEERISIAFFGDGALNEGLFYEVANMASLWRLPVIYVMENNLYGEYTSISRCMAGSTLARAEALGIPAVSVDGNDILAVYGAAIWATKRARIGKGPSFIECLTYRIRGHHMGDQGDTFGYRSKDEVDSWINRCPIRSFADRLVSENLVNQQELDKIDAQVQSLIDQAFIFGKESPYPDPAEVYEGVYV